MSPEPLDRPYLFEAGRASGPVVLALHGTGGDEHQGLQLARLVDADAPVLAPRGQVLEGGMNRFFARHAEGVFDHDDVVRRADELADFVEHARAAHDLGDRPVVAVGFSNGANVGLAVALRRPEVVRGALAFSGRWPLGEHRPAESLHGVALGLFGGDADVMAPTDDVERVRAAAEPLGAVVTVGLRPGGHGLTPHDRDAAARWWAERVTGGVDGAGY